MDKPIYKSKKAQLVSLIATAILMIPSPDPITVLFKIAALAFLGGCFAIGQGIADRKQVHVYRNLKDKKPETITEE